MTVLTLIIGIEQCYEHLRFAGPLPSFDDWGHSIGDGEATAMSRVDLETLAQPLLVDGEHVIAGVRVNWNGMVAPNRPTSALQLGLGPDEPAPSVDPHEAVEFPSAKQLALVLTGDRLLAWSLGISGRPKQYLGDVPLSAVVKVEAGEMQFGSLIRISLRSGAVVDLEAMRGEPGADFSAQLDAITAAS